MHEKERKKESEKVCVCMCYNLIKISNNVRYNNNISSKYSTKSI